MKINKAFLLSLISVALVFSSQNSQCSQVDLTCNYVQGISGLIIAVPVVYASSLYFKIKQIRAQNKIEIDNVKKELTSEQLAQFDIEYKAFDTWPCFYSGNVVAMAMASILMHNGSISVARSLDYNVAALTSLSSWIISCLWLIEHLEEMNKKELERVIGLVKKITNNYSAELV
jgi:hypothetical protein